MAVASSALLLIVLAVAPAPVCRAGQTDAVVRPIPPPIGPSVAAAFGVNMTGAEVQANGVMRCADGRLLACLVGADLNCGKPDTRMSNAGASGWCREHTNADFVPAFATGHDTKGRKY